MSIEVSSAEARRFLAAYHFTQTDLLGVFQRLGTVQYDPLNPVGRNPDLVLQARVPGYQVDDWQKAAYTDRSIYDAWDKQACLVPIADWSLRERTREHYRPYHDREILQLEETIAETIFQTLDKQGPLSSLEFEDRKRIKDTNGSWYGATNIKRALRAMWVCGDIVTHHRRNGRHYYDRPERVIPDAHYKAALLADANAYHRWIIARRYQAVGLLRPNAEACIWSACGDGATRKQATLQLIEDGTLTPIHVGEKRKVYYMPTAAIPLLNGLESAAPSPRVIFVAPLDSLLWDRKAIQEIFNFNYLWEVYKPLAKRQWGYYVLPVWYKDRFVARLDSRLTGKTWTILNWWWESDAQLDGDFWEALQLAIENFLYYMRADTVQAKEAVDERIQALTQVVSA